MMSDAINAKVVTAVGIGVAAAVGAHYWYRSKCKQVPPTKWKKVGALEEICLFPIKSCGGIELESANCGILGIQHENFKDRMFSLIDENHKLVSACTYPKLVTIQPRIIGNQLVITADGMNDLDIDFESIADGKTIKATISKTDVYVIECGLDYDKWFSKYLLDSESGLKLVYYSYPIPTREIVDNIFKNGIFLKSDTGALQDVSSYMLINQTSLDELNTRLENNKVHSRQLRGTFLVKTSTPAYDEDKWKWIKIGDDTIFRCLAPCYRCIFPNINAFTGERNSDGEPLKTLNKYRSFGKEKSPRMGVQLGIRVPGTVKRGDFVYVEDS